MHKKWEGMTTIEKYATFIGAINRDISWIKEEMERRSDKTLRLRSRDIAKRLGPMFESLDDPTIFWGVKYALYTEGIFVDTGKEKGTENYLLILKSEP